MRIRLPLLIALLFHLSLEAYDASSTCSTSWGSYDECGRLEVWGDYLYWQVCQWDQDYAIAGDNSTGVIQNGRVDTVGLEWRSGFRAGIIYQAPCTGWEMEVNYLRYSTEGTDSQDGNLILPVYLTPALQTSSISASVKEYIRYQSLDIIARHPCQTCYCLEFAPYVGLRGMILDNEVQASYNNGLLPPTIDSVIWHGNQWGVGLIGGFEMRWLGSACAIPFGKVAGFAVAGESKGNNRHYDGDTIYLNVREPRHCEMLSGWEGQIGVRTDWCLCDCSFYILVGYEMVYWQNVPAMRRWYDTTGSASSPSQGGQIGFHGGFARIGKAF